MREKLDKLARLRGAATQGEWCEFAGSLTIEADGHIVEEIAQFCGDNKRNNGQWIAAVHNAFPDLLEYVRELAGALEVERVATINRDAQQRREGAAEWLEHRSSKWFVMTSDDMKAEAQRLREGK